MAEQRGAAARVWFGCGGEGRVLGGPRAVFIGRRSALGVRARAGNRGVGFAGDRGRFPLRGRATREEEDGPGAWGRAGSGKTRALAGGPEAW